VLTKTGAAFPCRPRSLNDRCTAEEHSIEIAAALERINPAVGPRGWVNLAILSPQLVETILQGRQPVELTAPPLSELGLPLDWSEQHRLIAS